MTTDEGDILSIDYMLGSIQSFNDEEILSESKDAFMHKKARSLFIGIPNVDTKRQYMTREYKVCFSKCYIHASKI